MARCLGYVVLKLCVEEAGQSMVLNSGDFKLQILYGRIPEGPLKPETLQESMTPLPGAYLRVRLFDSARPQTDVDSKWTLKSKLSHLSGTSASKLTCEIDEESDVATIINCSQAPVRTVSIAEAVLHSYCSSSGTIGHNPPLPLNAAEALDVLQRVEEGELLRIRRLEIFEVVSRWTETCFPRPEEVKVLVSPGFLLGLDDNAGSLLGLDMLYNMPQRKNLIRAADQATIVVAIRQGMSSGWDNKIQYFKTVFRYLKGHSGDLSPQTEESSAEFIIDDASLRPALRSHELSPMYQDELSCTAGLRLSAKACLLVQVTAVDVLTSAKVSAQQANLVSAVHRPLSPRRSPHNSLTAEDLAEMSSIAETKRGKEASLRGLIGIYIGHNDEESNWWGILPLHQPLPVRREKSSQGKMGGWGWRMGDGREHAEGDNRDAQSGVKSPQDIFVHAGTHIIPLFKGLPPEEMISSPDPMTWLLSTLRAQRLVKMKKSWYGSVFTRLGLNGKSDEATSRSKSSGSPGMDRTDSSATDPKGRAAAGDPALLTLSRGASAVVRVVDARLRKTVNAALLENSSITPNNRALVGILRAYSARVDPFDSLSSSFPSSSKLSATSTVDWTVSEDGIENVPVDERKFGRLMARFQYNALKNAESRTLEASIPPTIDPHVLIEEINQKFMQTVE